MSEGVLGGPLLRRPGLDQSCRALLAGAPRLPLPLAVSKVLLPQPHQPISLILPLSALSHRLPSRPKMFIVISCLSPLFLSYPGVLNPQPVGKRNKRRAIHKTIYFSRKKKEILHLHSFHRKLMSHTPPNGRNKSDLHVFLRSKENRKRKNVPPRRSLITIGVLWATPLHPTSTCKT